MPDISVIVLNWNNAAVTARCLRGVFRLDGGPFQVVLVDNGSTDDSCQTLARRFPSIEIVKLPTNLGYGGGNNQGLRHVLKGTPGYVLILNNDVLPAKDMVTRLARALEADPRTAMVGPKILCAKPAHTVFSAGSFVEWTRGDVRHQGMFESLEAWPDQDGIQQVDFLAGCGMLVRGSFIREAGFLDEEYFLNFEDVEWGIRAWRAGYRVGLVSGARLWHNVSDTLGLASPANTYYMTRNALRFFRSHSKAGLRWLPVSCILLRTFRTVFAWTVRSCYRDDWFARKRTANCLAVRDFFRGRFGPMGPDVARVCYPKGGTS
jgi:GT2 family glycosyltransferase